MLEYADYWFNTGNQEPVIEESDDRFGLNVAWGMYEKKSLEHTMYNLWIEFVTFGKKALFDTAVV